MILLRASVSECRLSAMGIGHIWKPLRAHLGPRSITANCTKSTVRHRLRTFGAIPQPVEFTASSTVVFPKAARLWPELCHSSGGKTAATGCAKFSLGRSEERRVGKEC